MPLVKKYVVFCRPYGYSLRNHIKSMFRNKHGWINLGIPIIWDD